MEISIFRYVHIYIYIARERECKRFTRNCVCVGVLYLLRNVSFYGFYTLGISFKFEHGDGGHALNEGGISS